MSNVIMACVIFYVLTVLSLLSRGTGWVGLNNNDLFLSSVATWVWNSPLKSQQKMLLLIKHNPNKLGDNLEAGL